MKKRNSTNVSANVVANAIASVETFNVVKGAMKDNRKDLKLWRTSYNSLSRLMRDTQLREFHKITFPIFEKVGIPTTGKVKPGEIIAMLHQSQIVKDANGVECYAYTTRKAVKDADGNNVKDADGNNVYEYNTATIKAGGWTLDKLVKLIATANALKK